MMKRVGDADKQELKGLTPDEWDFKNISNLIEMWCKSHPRGWVRYQQDDKPAPMKKTMATNIDGKAKANPVLVEYLNPYDHIEYMRSVVKQDRKLSAVIEKKKGNPIHLDTSLPPSFAAMLRRGYPTLLTDRKQTLWFLRKFPQFKL